MLLIIKSSNFSISSCSKYYRQILFHLVFSKFAKLHCVSIQNFSKYGEHKILGQNIFRKIYKWQILILQKFIHQNHNQHISNNVPLYQISVTLENKLRLYDQICPKISMTKNLKK